MCDISLRAYFAAHAPAEPADWFEVNYPVKHPEFPKGAKWCDGCQAGGDCDGSESCETMRSIHDARRQWEEQRFKAIAVQWRWAWADAMIEGMNGQKAAAESDLTAQAVEALREIVKHSHLAGGWIRKPDGTFSARHLRNDVEVHPDRIEKARQVLAKLDGGPDA